MIAARRRSFALLLCLLCEHIETLFGGFLLHTVGASGEHGHKASVRTDSG